MRLPLKSEHSGLNRPVTGIGAIVILCLFSIDANAQLRGDACQAQIPRTLANALARTFPGYRTPLEYDNPPEDIEKMQPKSGTGCLGVATADFTGEGKKDYLIGLTAVKGSGGLTVVAFPRRGGTWRFYKISSEDARYRYYVDVVEPGRYARPKGVTAPLGPGEKQSIDCSNRGAHVGVVGSTGMIYCYDGSQWLHVRVSD